MSPPDINPPVNGHLLLPRVVKTAAQFTDYQLQLLLYSQCEDHITTWLFFRWHERITTNLSNKGDDAEQQRFALYVAINQDDMWLQPLSGYDGKQTVTVESGQLLPRGCMCLDISLGRQKISN